MLSYKFIVVSKLNTCFTLAYVAKNKNEELYLLPALELIKQEDVKIRGVDDIKSLTDSVPLHLIDNIRELYNIVGNLHLILNNDSEVPTFYDEDSDINIWDTSIKLSNEEIEFLKDEEKIKSIVAKQEFEERLNSFDFSPLTQEELEDLNGFLEDTEGDIDVILDNE